MPSFDLASDAKPLGLQVARICDELFRKLPHVDAHLQRLCEVARKAQQPELKQSVFGLLAPAEIKHFLSSVDNSMWHEIMENTEKFLEDLRDKKKARAPKYSVEEMTPAPKDKRLRSLRPIVMDQSVREPATNTPYGHSGLMKYLTLKIVQAMGFKDIAITGLYYGNSYTPETQVLEELRDRGEAMDGMIAMFGPGKVRDANQPPTRFRVQGLWLFLRKSVYNGDYDLSHNLQRSFILRILIGIPLLLELPTSRRH